MEIIDIRAGLGGMLKGMQAAGFVPVLAVERSPTARACLERNLGVKTAPSIPPINEVPRHECLCGSFRSGMSEDDRDALVRILTCKPRGILFELGHRFDVSGLKSLLCDVGYCSWSLALNANGWSDICRKSTFLVSFRSDIKRFFSEFPFPEEVNHGVRPSLIVDAKGDCGLDLGTESAKLFVGLPGFDMAGISQRRIFAEPSVEMVKSIGVEMEGWLHN
jgi:hypothetical protein